MTQTEFELDPYPPAQLFKHSPYVPADSSLKKLLGAYDTLLDRFMPPSIIVDDQWMILDSYAGADQYLRMRSRRPSHSVKELLCEPLRKALLEAIDRLSRGEAPAMISPIEITAEHGCESPLTLTLTTVPNGDERADYYSITIEPCQITTRYPAIKQGERPAFVRETTEYEQLTPTKTADCDLESFLEATQLPVVFLDHELRIRRFTSQAGQLFNLVQHDIGREIRTFAAVLEVPDLVDRIRAVIHTGDADEVEVHLHRLNHHFVARIAPFPSHTDVNGAVLTLIDLSELESRLQDIRWLSSIVQSTDDAIISRDRDNHIVTWNSGAEDLFGYSAEEAIGQNISLIVPSDQEVEPSQTLRTLQKGGHFEPFDSVRRAKCGRLLSVSVRLSPVYDDDHRVVGMSTIERDISRQCEVLEEQIRQSELRYRNSFQNNAIGIAQVDIAGRYLMANRRLCEIVGYTAEELSQLRFTDITHPEDLAKDLTMREDLLAGRAENYVIEKRYIHKQGHEVWASLFVSLERGTDGQPLSCHAYVEDISSRKELESNLRLAISQRDQFLAMLSHELRNPLGAILSTCAVLHRGRGLPKNMQQPISVVTRQARQMAELLDDLLDVSRITSGKIKLEKSPTVLSEIVDEAVESQQGLAASRHQRLLVTYADEPLHIFGDRSRLVQVVVNLLNNAIKYSGDGGVIKLTLEKRGRFGIIRVQDSGVGIKPELIESLFEMFAQQDSTLDRSGGGMGLGLHLVRKLVEFHSGRVFGRSDGFGKGSEFTVELPLSTRPRGTRVPKTPLPLDKPRRREVNKIVVVEDIADARNMLVALLEADDFEVSSAADGEAGLNLILQSRPDLAIVDIGLPKLDGYEVAKRIREQIPQSELTLIALSGYGQDSDHDRALDAGFDIHMVKPLNQARLAMILGRS